VSRRVVWVVLCEDEQHYAFARRFLAHMTQPGMRECYKVLGPGHQGVRAKLGAEVLAIRRRGSMAALLAILDADGHGVAARRRYVLELCREEEIPRADDPVAVLVPERNIETWIAWLGGAEVDAVTRYPKLRRERDCEPAVKRLKELCDANKALAEFPASLAAACEDFERMRRLLG